MTGTRPARGIPLPRPRRWLRQTRDLRKKERRWTGRRRPHLWFRGFLSEAADIYDFATHGYDAYLSDYARFVRSQEINHPDFETILSNKLFWHDRLAQEGFADRKPDLLGILVAGSLHPVGGGPTTLGAAVDSTAGIVVKSLSGGGGGGLRIVERKGDTLALNGEPVSEDELQGRLSSARPAIVERRIDQHAYAAELFPRTTNTIRVLTLLDVDGGEPFVAAAVQRVGGERSYPMDHWRHGGYCCGIDVESGVLGPAASFPDRAPAAWHDTHPDTGARFTGTAIPCWDDAVELVTTLTSCMRYLPYVGWDVVITHEGARVIEGNSYSGVNLLQVHRPLLTDPRVRRFYEHYGVI